MVGAKVAMMRKLVVIHLLTSVTPYSLSPFLNLTPPVVFAKMCFSEKGRGPGFL